MTVALMTSVLVVGIGWFLAGLWICSQGPSCQGFHENRDVHNDDNDWFSGVRDMPSKGGRLQLPWSGIFKRLRTHLVIKYRVDPKLLHRMSSVMTHHTLNL